MKQKNIPAFIRKEAGEGFKQERSMLGTIEIKFYLIALC